MMLIFARPYIWEGGITRRCEAREREGESTRLRLSVGGYFSLMRPLS